LKLVSRDQIDADGFIAILQRRIDAAIAEIALLNGYVKG
jgi:hypothetical protein